MCTCASVNLTLFLYTNYLYKYKYEIARPASSFFKKKLRSLGRIHNIPWPKILKNKINSIFPVTNRFKPVSENPNRFNRKSKIFLTGWIGWDFLTGPTGFLPVKT